MVLEQTLAIHKEKLSNVQPHAVRLIEFLYFTSSFILKDFSLGF